MRRSFLPHANRLRLLRLQRSRNLTTKKHRTNLQPWAAHTSCCLEAAQGYSPSQQGSPGRRPRYGQRGGGEGPASLPSRPVQVQGGPRSEHLLPLQHLPSRARRYLATRAVELALERVRVVVVWRPHKDTLPVSKGRPVEGPGTASVEPPSSPPAAKKPKPDDQEAPNKPATMGGAHEQAEEMCGAMRR
jgi:hypothetical protein